MFFKIMTRKIFFFIFISVLFVSILRLFVIDFAIINGKSMEPLLNEGDLFIINRASYGILIPFSNQYIIRWSSPLSGDIVLYSDPVSSLKTVKRCIAIAGDQIVLHENTLYISNYEIPLKYYQENILKKYTEVPADSVFVLGENIDFSSDSRSVGFIDIESIKGAAMFGIGDPSDGSHSSRENRSLQSVFPDITKR